MIHFSKTVERQEGLCVYKLMYICVYVRPDVGTSMTRSLDLFSKMGHSCKKLVGPVKKVFVNVKCKDQDKGNFIGSQ